MKEQTDLTVIIDGCRENDPRAQSQLYRQMYEFAMQIAMRYSRDEDDAANIVTLAFVKMFKSILSFDASKGSIHNWLKTIIIHEAVDFIKSWKKGNIIEDTEEAVVLMRDNGLIEKLTASELLELIRALPEATLAVFNLYVMEGYNHKEIASMIGISEGTSKWHLSNARKKLQEKIAVSNIK